MNTIEAKSDTPNITYDMSDEQKDFETAAALKRSIWEVLDSDNLRKIRRLPSRWSKAFFASANVKWMITDRDILILMLLSTSIHEEPDLIYWLLKLRS